MNRQVQLQSRPNGIPQAENFRVVDAPMPELQDGQVLVRNIYLSVEPAMRGWVSAAANYSEPVAIGGVMRSFAVGRVVESKHPDYAVGEYVTGLFGWQDHAAVDAATIQRKVSADGAPISTALGVLGSVPSVASPSRSCRGPCLSSPDAVLVTLPPLPERLAHSTALGLWPFPLHCSPH